MANTGNKSVNDVSVSITNPLCTGAVPPISNTFAAQQKKVMYLYTTAQNGTITLSGNNTLLLIRF
ncbi:MAG: hypothetical protein ACREBS_00605 [Nitrososphaerales archaeon]